MPTIKEIREKVDLAKNGIEQETAKIVAENQDKIVDYIRNDQIQSKGVDSKGKVIGKYKRNYTSDSVGGWGDVYKITNAGLPKKIGNNYNLTWSGYTLSNLRAEYNKFNIFIFNEGSSSDFMEKKYGKNIFKLSQENKEKLSSEIIIPNLVNYFRKYFK